MKKYEIMYILKASLETEVLKKQVEKLQNILTKNGAKVIENKAWGEGVRDFAYPINGETKGYYYVAVVSATSAILEEFSRLVRIDENVVRFLITAYHEKK